MYFLDDEHKNNFYRLLDRFPRAQKDRPDREYRVACYIVALPEVYRKIDGQTGKFPFSWSYNDNDGNSKAYNMLSSGYKKIVNLGRNLYNDQNPFNLGEALGNWDYKIFQVAKQAVDIRRPV